MEAALDMNSNRIINLPEPVEDTEPARLRDLKNVSIGLVGDDIIDAANAAAATAAAAAIRAEQSALGKVNPNLDNAVFPAINFTSTFQDNLV